MTSYTQYHKLIKLITRNLFRLGSSVLFTVMLVTRGYSQEQQITFLQPLTNQTGSWSIDLNNKTGKPISVLLKVSLQYDKRGTVIEFSTQKIQMESYISLPWKLLTSTYIKNSSVQPDFKNAFAGNESLHQGDYKICLFLLTEASVTVAENCESFTVDRNNVFPPLLIEPSHNDTIHLNYPLFTWSPPGPLTNNIPSYELYLYEIINGQTPETSVIKNQPYHQVKSIKEPFYAYPSNALALKENQAYAWQIIAQVDGQVLPSNIESFVLGKYKEVKRIDTKPKGAMYFQLSTESGSDFYQITQTDLYFIYLNETTTKSVIYSILDVEGAILTTNKLEATYGYNLFSIDLTQIKLTKDSFYQLIVKKDNTPVQQLRFLVNY